LIDIAQIVEKTTPRISHKTLMSVPSIPWLYIKTSGLLKAQLVQKREKNRGGKDGMRRLIN
jgi:hypothetical protein